MSYRGREVRDLLERLEGRLSRAVLRGLGGSNALPATRLLEKWGRQCVYCGAKGVPLELEHITPRAKTRDDRVCNLTLACHRCNEKKGAQDIRDFLKHKPNLLQKLLAQAKAPLKDAAAVNGTRWALYRRLQEVDLPVECGSGGRTKYNRTLRGLTKAHWTDAACVATPVMGIHC
jgi:5-methylcytosine-specific restriction endonuclease McrA